MIHAVESGNSMHQKSESTNHESCKSILRYSVDFCVVPGLCALRTMIHTVESEKHHLPRFTKFSNIKV